MTAPTRLVLRGIIDSVLADSEVTDAEINDAINEAVLSVRGDMLITSAVSTPAGALTVSVPAGFVYVYSVELGTDPIPSYAWWIREDATTPVIVFSEAYFGGAPSGTLAVTGGTFQEILSADGDFLKIDPGYVTARALASLHASRGGTASDLADWHRSEHSKWAAIAENRAAVGMAVYGPPAGSRLIKGRLTG